MQNFTNQLYFSGLAVLLFLLLILITGCSQPAKKSKGSLELKDGLLYKIGSDKPFTGTEDAFANNKRIVYDVVDGKKNGNFKIYYDNKNLEIEGQLVDNKNTGLWKYYFPNGKLESEGVFENDSANGEWKWYFENGNIREIGSFNNGVKEGKWYIYSQDGGLIKETEFKDGNEVEKK